MSKTLSLVVPVYNDGKIIDKLYEGIKSTFASGRLANYSWRIVFVDDGSDDDSWRHIEKLVGEDRVHVKGMRLSRNFGKEVALSAGVAEMADSDAVMCLDADLQHPPELIPEFVEKWENGAEVVVGIRKKTSGYGFFKALGSRLFYKIMDYFSEIKIEPQSTDFRLMDKNVVTAFCRFSERSRMFRGLVDWLGFRRDYIEFDAPERGGDTKPTYSIKKLTRLAINSIISFSWLPLRITGYMGGAVVMLSVLVLFVMAVTHFFHLAYYTIQAYFIVFLTFLVGVILSAIGFLALYIEQIHRQVQNRPLYVVAEKVGLSFDSELSEPEVLSAAEAGH